MYRTAASIIGAAFVADAATAVVAIAISPI